MHASLHACSALLKTELTLDCSAAADASPCGQDSHTSWAAYVAGCLLVLARERGAQRLAGLSVSILVSSDVPEGGWALW